MESPEPSEKAMIDKSPILEIREDKPASPELKKSPSPKKEEKIEPPTRF
jgi:hypothetical protein